MSSFKTSQALIVAVSKYQFHPLPESLRTGAKRLGKQLCETGGYSEENVKLLLDEAATRPRILGALDGLSTCDPGATIFLYFAGHGALISEGEDAGNYFITSDADRSDPVARVEHALSRSHLDDFLQRIPARRIFLVLDCCHAADLASVKDPHRVPFSEFGQRPAPGRGRVVVAASRTKEAAWTGGGEHTPICTALLDGLRGNAASGSGYVYVFDLVNHVFREIQTNDVDQVPVFKSEIESNFPVAMAPTPRPSLARPNDEHPYDVYLNYIPDDRDWVLSRLVPALTERGVRVLTGDDFQLGAPSLDEIERAIEESRYCLAVLSQASQADGFADLAQVMAQHLGREDNEHRLLTVRREPCPLRLRLRIQPPLDLFSDHDVDIHIERLIESIWRPRRQRRGVSRK